MVVGVVFEEVKRIKDAGLEEDTIFIFIFIVTPIVIITCMWWWSSRCFWVENYEDCKLSIIEKMTNQKKLARIAKRSKKRTFRRAAVRNVNLTDQTVLADIAKTDSDSEVRTAAVQNVNLTDQTVLADIAKNDSDWNVRIAAAKKLTDQVVLADVAINASDWNVRKAVVEKFTDQTLLADIAINDKRWEVRVAAYKQLGDEQNAWALIAKNNSNSDVRIAATRKLLEFDLGEDLLTVLIGMLGNELKHSENKSTKENAADALLSFYRRYGNSKHGEEIRKYEGTRVYGYSDHTDYEDGSASSGASYCNGHTDFHTDSRYSVNFNTKEA
jgi:hypothetical protein